MPLSASSPLVLEMDDSEGLYAPLRESRAKIRWAARTGDAPFATGDKTHKVEISRAGTVVWRGWLEPETWSQDLTTAPVELEVSARCGLELLDGTDYDGGGIGTVTAWDLLWDAAETAGTTRIVFPRSYYSNRMTAATADVRDWLSSLDLSRSVLDDGEGDPVSWHEAVEGLVKFLQWTLWDTGGEWVLVDVDARGCEYVAYDGRGATATTVDVGGGELMPKRGAGAIAPAGADHKVETLQPYGRFTVEPPDEALGATDDADAMEADFTRMERYHYGGWGKMLINGDDSPAVTTSEQPTFEAGSFYVLDDSTGQDGAAVTVETLRYRYGSDAGTDTPDGVDWLYWPEEAGRADEWAEACVFWPGSAERAGSGRELVKMYGAVPMLWADYEYKPYWNGQDEEVDPLNPDFKGIVRIVTRVFDNWVGTDIAMSGLASSVSLASPDVQPFYTLFPLVRWKMQGVSIQRGRLMDVRATFKLLRNFAFTGMPSDVYGFWVVYSVSWDGGNTGIKTVRMKIETATEQVITTNEKHETEREWLDGMDDIEGFCQIDTDTLPERTDVTVTLYMPIIQESTYGSNLRVKNVLCVDVSDFEIAFVRRGTYSDDNLLIDGTWDSERTEKRQEQEGHYIDRWTVGNGSDYETVTEMFTSMDGYVVTGGACVVTSDGAAVTEFDHVRLGLFQPEALMLQRLQRHYEKTRHAWELEVDDTETTPAAAWTCGGVAAVCGGWSRDAYAGVMTLRLEEL